MSVSKEYYNPLISVVVTIYNKEKYLIRCIDSIIKQTYKNIELVLVDDGSTDGSLLIAKEFVQKDNRVRLFHKQNEGLVKARKDGITYSRGEYIVFVDGDDFIEANSCEIFAKNIVNYHDDLVIGGIVKVFDFRRQIVKDAIRAGRYEGEELKRQVIEKMIYTGRFFEKGLSGYICGKAIRRDLLERIEKNIEEDIDFAEGCVWLYSTLFASNKVCVLDDVLYNYYMNEGSMTISRVDDKEIYKVFKCIAENIAIYMRNDTILLKQNKILAFYHLLWKKMDLLNDNEEIIYPFTELKKTSRIVLYGAYRYGRELLRYFEKRDYCEIVMIADKNICESVSLGYTIHHPNEIVNYSYDYIVLGAITYSVIQDMIKTLNEIGIYERILYMSSDRIDLERLPQVYKV